MDILLDTHMLLCWLTDDSRLSKKARALIADPANMLAVSAATAWGIAIQPASGKIAMDGTLEQTIHEQGFARPRSAMAASISAGEASRQLARSAASASL